jgi:hypothetical protein
VTEPEPPDSPAWWAAEARRWADVAEDHARSARWAAFAAFLFMAVAVVVAIVGW